MLNAMLLAFATVFAAELGDKSQLLALSLASRYRTPLLLAAVTTAAALTMGASVLVGAALGSTLPTRPLLIVAALLFFGFAVRTWVEAPDEDDGDEPGGTGGFFAIVAGISLAELGDKTMVAALALAATTSAWGVWIGGTLGMASAGALAVLVGKALWQRLSPDAVRRVAAVLFAVMGVVLLVEALR